MERLETYLNELMDKNLSVLLDRVRVDPTQPSVLFGTLQKIITDKKGEVQAIVMKNWGLVKFDVIIRMNEYVPKSKENGSKPCDNVRTVDELY